MIPMRSLPVRPGLLAAALLFVSAATAVAGGPNLAFDEDFRTTAMRDAAATTAVWNTSAGTLSLAPFTPTTVGATDGVGRAYSVAAYGHYACVAALDRGLFVVDLSDPAHPAPLATVELGGEPRAVSIAGSLAAVAARDAGVIFVDLSRPAQPDVRGELHVADNVMGVALVGRYAYLAAMGAGLVIVDVADPTAPVVVGSAVVDDRAMGVIVDGDQAYVAGYRGGVAVFDVNAPATPVRVGTMATDGPALALALSGDLLAVAASAAGVELYDVTQPAAPTRLGVLPTAGSATDVAFQQRMLLTTTTAARLLLHDLTDPLLPVAKWTKELVGPGRGVAVYGDLGLVALDEAGLEVVQLEEPAADLIGQTGYYGTDVHDPRDVAVAGQVAYMATEPEGLLVVSIPNRGLSARLAAMTTPGKAVAVAVSGNLVCVADSLSGLRTFDVTVPSAPVGLGGYDTSGQALDVALTNNVACVADGTGGLKLVSIADPNAPTLIATCALPGVANAVAVWGTLAVVTDGGLRLVDISHPATPVLVGSYTGLGGAAKGVAMQGNVAWVTAGASGLYAIDVSDPVSPTVLSVTPVAPSLHPYRTPAVWGRRVVALEYGGTSSGFVRILDGSTPSAPSLVLRWDTYQYYLNGIVLDGDRVLTLFGAPTLNSVGGLTTHLVGQPDVAGALSGLGQSLNLVPDLPYIVCVRLTAQETSGVTWKMWDSDSSHSILGNGTWLDVNRSGYGLRWRASLTWKSCNPTVDDLQVEWRLREARVDSVVDVRGDQGGWAHLYLTGSGFDLRAGTISGYNVYRRVDDVALAAQVRAAKRARAAGAEVELDGVTYVVNEPTAASTGKAATTDAAKDAPVGVWSIVASFFPTRQDHYVVTVPTARDDGPDGPGWSAYYVTAWQGSTGSFFHSLPDSGRSVDNLAPGVPAGLAAAYTASGASLHWQPAPERDFQYHRVYRGTWPGFTPSPATLVGVTSGTTFTDATPEPWTCSYKLTTVDHAGNESPAASPATVSGVGDVAAPAAFALRGSEPNPFNAGTTVRWDVPEGGGRVELAIFDARGCRVRTLVDEVLPAGRHSLRWDGRDQAGRKVATGTYFCRLAAAGRAMGAIKMSLVQ